MNVGLRRLASVVDRRVVVDPASEEAETIVKRLEEALESEDDHIPRFSVEEENREPRVLQRLEAGKRSEEGKRPQLREPSGSPAADLAQWAVEVIRSAREHGEKPAVGVVLNTVRAARDAHTELQKHLRERSLDPDSVLVLTGSMRRIERDEIVSADGTGPEALLASLPEKPGFSRQPYRTTVADNALSRGR